MLHGTWLMNSLSLSLRIVCYPCDVSMWCVYLSRWGMLTYFWLCSNSCQALFFCLQICLADMGVVSDLSNSCLRYQNRVLNKFPVKSQHCSSIILIPPGGASWIFFCAESSSSRWIFFKACQFFYCLDIGGKQKPLVYPHTCKSEGGECCTCFTLTDLEFCDTENQTTITGLFDDTANPFILSSLSRIVVSLVILANVWFLASINYSTAA